MVMIAAILFWDATKFQFNIIRARANDRTDESSTVSLNFLRFACTFLHFSSHDSTDLSHTNRFPLN